MDYTNPYPPGRDWMDFEQRARLQQLQLDQLRKQTEEMERTRISVEGQARQAYHEGERRRADQRAIEEENERLAELAKRREDAEEIQQRVECMAEIIDHNFGYDTEARTLECYINHFAKPSHFHEELVYKLWPSLPESYEFFLKNACLANSRNYGDFETQIIRLRTSLSGAVSKIARRFLSRNEQGKICFYPEWEIDSNFKKVNRTIAIFEFDLNQAYSQKKYQGVVEIYKKLLEHVVTPPNEWKEFCDTTSRICDRYEDMTKNVAGVIPIDNDLDPISALYDKLIECTGLRLLNPAEIKDGVRLAMARR